MSRVHTEVRDGIAWVRMDDGKVNAMSVAMMEEINAALDTAESEGCVVVLAGREGIFSAGFDMKTFAGTIDDIRAMLIAGATLIERFLAFPFPIVSMCTGHAYPMGAFLMLASDRRFGARGPWRIGMNETAVPLVLPWFAIEIARHRLSPAAFGCIASAVLFNPDEAVGAGYLDAAVEPEELEELVAAEATRLRTLDMKTYAATKARINEGVRRAMRRTIEEELESATSMPV